MAYSEDEPRAGRRARPAQESAQEERGGMRWGRVIVYAGLILTFLAGSLIAWHRTTDFLIRDDRFRLAEAATSSGQSPNLLVEGAHYASPPEIRHIFAPDLGRSLYLTPVEERRAALLAIDWVAEASVSKIWPNTLMVQVKERQPVAFVELPPVRAGGPAEFALVDREGMILRPRVPAKFTLPLVRGVRESEDRPMRKRRVAKAMAMMDELGEMAAAVGEINVSDLSNLVVSERIGGRVVTLLLGEDSFRNRMAYFMSSYPEIKAKRPDATTFDLRLDGVIAAGKADQFAEGDQNDVR
jgi:cell division protein FtsQ